MDQEEYYSECSFVPVPSDGKDNFVTIYNQISDIENELDQYYYIIDFIYSLALSEPKKYGELKQVAWEYDHESPIQKTEETLELDMKLGLAKLSEDQQPVFELFAKIIMAITSSDSGCDMSD